MTVTLAPLATAEAEAWEIVIAAIGWSVRATGSRLGGWIRGGRRPPCCVGDEQDGQDGEQAEGDLEPADRGVEVAALDLDDAGVEASALEVGRRSAGAGPG